MLNTLAVDIREITNPGNLTTTQGNIIGLGLHKAQTISLTPEQLNGLAMKVKDYSVWTENGRDLTIRPQTLIQV